MSGKNENTITLESLNVGSEYIPSTILENYFFPIKEESYPIDSETVEK